MIFCKYCNGQLASLHYVEKRVVDYISSRVDPDIGERCRLSMLSDNTGNMLTIVIMHGLRTTPQSQLTN